MRERIVDRDDAAGGGADKVEAIKREVRGESLEFVERASLGAPIVGEEAETGGGERRNLVRPHASVARPRVQEDDRRSLAAQRRISPRNLSTPGWMSSRRGAAATVFAIVVSRACSRRAPNVASPW